MHHGRLHNALKLTCNLSIHTQSCSLQSGGRDARGARTNNSRMGFMKQEQILWETAIQEACNSTFMNRVCVVAGAMLAYFVAA